MFHNGRRIAPLHFFLYTFDLERVKVKVKLKIKEAKIAKKPTLLFDRKSE